MGKSRDIGQRVRTGDLKYSVVLYLIILHYTLESYKEPYCHLCLYLQTMNNKEYKIERIFFIRFFITKATDMTLNQPNLL